MWRRPVAALAVLALAALATPGCAPAPPQEPPAATPRLRQALDGPWRFTASDSLEGAEAERFDDGAWESVRLPHPWAGRDPAPHSHAWYRLRFRPPAGEPGQRLYLLFEGAATVADVYVNGRRLGQHRGAYTRFAFDATEALRPEGDNLLAVRLDNTREGTEDCLPSGRGKQLYQVLGGLHRRVWLVRTAAVHLDPADLAGPGLSFFTRDVSERRAAFTARLALRNAGATAQPLEARLRLRDASGRVVFARTERRELPAGARTRLELAGELARPRLWGPGHPELYELSAELWVGGRAVDAVSQRVGFRDFQARDGRFRLNGQPLLIRGVGLHQESERSRSAVGDAEIEETFRHLADLGVNMVRLAHYPHSELAYDLADRLGLLVWAENGHSNEVEPGDNGEALTREMVRQLLNHPSVVCWSVGNETGYLGVRRLAAAVREEDPTRPVTYASNTGFQRRLAKPLDFVSHNVYAGWYPPLRVRFEEAALEAGLISETGGGALLTQHTGYEAPVRKIDRFEPEEYRQQLAESQLQTVFGPRRDEVPMYLVWILRDFGLAPHKKFRGVNTKGLLTRGNRPKDVYWLYRSFLRPEVATLHVASQSWFLRQGREGDAVKVYSNAAAVELSVNGVAAGRRANGAYRLPDGQPTRNVFLWRGLLQPGRNEVLARDGAGHEARAVLHYLPEGQAGWPDRPEALLQGLRSSNPGSPAFFIDAPVQEQGPFHHDFAGGANNTFAELPEQLRGAAWIATRRLSAPENRTDLSFRAGRAAEVWVLCSPGAGPLPKGWPGADFTDGQVTGEWRGDDLRLVPFRTFRARAGAGQALRVPGATLDYVVLVKPAR